MITYNELKEKCDCWTGYKRKPGTKPCAEGSCVKEEKDAGGHGSEKHHVMAFGRMNPITSGHEAVVNKVHEVAKKHDASHSVIVSHSQDAKKNPLTGEQKVKHAKNAFPGTNVSSASKDKPTILHHAAEAHKSGAEHLHVVAGSDRKEEMHNLLHKYNGKDSAHGHYNFKSITVHSSGERDPDSEGTTGISASKMREHAASGNKEAFHAGAPSKMKPEHKDAMYHDVRKGMNIKEETTPYWKKPSFNRRMSALAKQERLAREKKEAEKKPVKEETVEEGVFKGVGQAAAQTVRVPYRAAKRVVKGALAVAGGVADTVKDVGDAVGKIKRSFKEETVEQQDDHAKQLKRFKDQMMHANGPTKETETDLDKLEKEIMAGHTHHGLMHNPDPMVDSHVRVGKIKHMSEKLEPSMGAGAYIHDFVHSTNPMFNNKSKEERRKMAIGAYMAAKAKLKEGAYEDSEENKRSADSAKKQGDMFAHHLHMADHHDNLSQWHSEKGRHNVADIHARKSEEHHEKAMSLKEGTMQPNGTDQIDTATSAPTASTAKDTTMGKTIKGFKFFKGENDKQMNMNQPVKEAKDSHEYADGEMSIHELKQIKAHSEWILEMLEPDTDLPEWVQAKITLAADYLSTACDYLHVEMNEETLDEKLIGGQKKLDKNHNGKLDKKDFELLRKEEVEELDEKSDQARRNKTWKNLMATSKGAQINRNTLGMKPSDTGHKNARDMNKAIGRAAARGELDETVTGNPGNGYHGAVQSPDEKYKETHAHVKNLTDGDDKTVKHYMDSTHGRHLAGNEHDHEYIKKDFKKFKKYYKPEMHEAAPVNVDKVNTAGDKPHEEKWEPAKKVSKIKKEETMKTYKEFVEDYLLEYESDKEGRYVHKGKSYGANYEDPAGAFETKDDMKKPEKKAAGRKEGQRTGSYKPRATMSKLKAAGATYK